MSWYMQCMTFTGAHIVLFGVWDEKSRCLLMWFLQSLMPMTQDRYRQDEILLSSNTKKVHRIWTPT